MPHKEVTLECMDEIDPIAKKIGATNNIVRRPDGWLIAFNTDYIGAISSIEDGLQDLNGATQCSGSPLAGKLFVVLGAGGAGKALAYGAAEKGARVVIVNRTLGRAQELAQKVGGQAISLSEVESFHPEEGMVLANTTSVGIAPSIDKTPIAKHALKHYCLVFDAVYTPKHNRLLQEAKGSVAVIVDGTEMLIRQGFEQYKNFTGLPAPEELFRQVVKNHT